MFFRFVELGALIDPGKAPKTDKAAILVDAVRMVTQLRTETQKLKDSNLSLQDKIKELKVRIFLYCFVLPFRFPLVLKNLSHPSMLLL